MAQNVSAVAVERHMLQPVKHPIKAARLLFIPPSWVLRGPVYMVFVITFAALLYSFVATVDNLVASPLTLQRESNDVEAVGGGMVAELSVKENEPVRFGEPLLTIQEQTRITADSDVSVLEGRIFDLQRELDKIRSEYEYQISQIEMNLTDVTTNRDAKRAAMEGTVSQIEQQQAIAGRTTARTADRLRLAREQFERQNKLYQTRDITIREFEAAQQMVLELEKDLDDARAESAKVAVSLATAKEELASLLDLQQKQKLETELEQTRQRRDRDIKRLEDEIAAARTRMTSGQNLVEGVTFDQNLTHYKSNFNGLVTSVHIKRGQLIGPGARLVTIVRDTAPLEARILVRNQDIGNLKRGQAVKIKYFAYPYQEYGIQQGNIVDIATKPGGVPGAESMYVVTVALESETIARRGATPKPLEIGLEGIAEVKTGEKRLIEIVFAPVSRFFEPEE